MAEPVDTEAFVVRSVDYGETDRILTLLTRDRGKLSAIARGARRSTRRFAGALQPFQVIRVTLAPRRGSSLALLGEAELVRAFTSIPGDPVRYAHASLAAELLRELTPEAELDERPFALLSGYLDALERRGPGVRLLAELVLSALTLAGFAPRLDRCVVCGAAAPPSRAAAFDPGRGVVCRACGGAPLLMRGRVRAALLAASAGARVEGTDDGDLSEGLDLLLAFARGKLGRDLRSAALLAALGPGRR